MNYISTRGASGTFTSAETIKLGPAPDGGLFMPEFIPEFVKDNLKKIAGMQYPERAAYILSHFLNDFAFSSLLDDCRIAYSDDRFTGGCAPVVSLEDNMHILELWHGPTCAFKDMALQIMPRLLTRALHMTGEKRTACILVATSGDTGKAALEGYRDADGVRIIVFYPVKGVSRIQKLQMATQEGNNVEVRPVRGNFDDTQNGVKKIFNDKNTAGILSDNGYFLSSANSINWGRLAPQIVYYISAYCDLINSGKIESGEEINICVPTGNFGNILAAYIAGKAGLPVGKLICASNRNNILTDFIKTGCYDRNRQFYTTISPSMDILISSNLERLLYMNSGSARTAAYMKSLSESGMYKASSDIITELGKKFYGSFCDDEETAVMIKQIFNEYNYLIDTHTAVGMKCANHYLNKTRDTRHMLVVSTASPYKFASSVYSAITGQQYYDEFANIAALHTMTKVPVPPPLSDLTNKKIRFDPDSAIDADDMNNELLRSLRLL